MIVWAVLIEELLEKMNLGVGRGGEKFLLSSFGICCPCPDSSQKSRAERISGGLEFNLLLRGGSALAEMFRVFSNLISVFPGRETPPPSLRVTVLEINHCPGKAFPSLWLEFPLMHLGGSCLSFVQSQSQVILGHQLHHCPC